MEFDGESKLKEIVLKYPATAPILERAGLDYCCGGKQSLGEACLQAGASTEKILARLRDAAGAAGRENDSWAAAPLEQVTRHIITRHHGYVREAVPRLRSLFGKVRQKHEERHPELSHAEELLVRLGRELSMHMQKEECILFPHIEQLARAGASGQSVDAPFFGTVQNPIAAMINEHDSAGELVNEIRKETSGYAAPEDACTTYQLLYKELGEFDHDLRTHVHLENNVLFPRAIELEQQATYV